MRLYQLSVTHMSLERNMHLRNFLFNLLLLEMEQEEYPNCEALGILVNGLQEAPVSSTIYFSFRYF